MHPRRRSIPETLPYWQSAYEETRREFHYRKERAAGRQNIRRDQLPFDRLGPYGQGGFKHQRCAQSEKPPAEIFRESDLVASDVAPDAVIDSVADLPRLLATDYWK